MELYAGFDLHSNNSHLGVIDKEGKQVFSRRIVNHPKEIDEALSPFRDKLTGVAVESTYNWYWLVDLLMDNGLETHLANPAAIQKYSGLKHADDKSDALWLAEMLRLGILPTGFIYPKETRPIRDLLRKRRHLVSLRTSLIISLKNIIARNCAVTIKANDVKLLKTDVIGPLLEHDDDLAMAGAVSKQTIDYLTRMIRSIEGVVEQREKLQGPYLNLTTLPGVGKILGMTIGLETGPVSRFAGVGNYASYCRKVSSQWTSNEKPKGRGNKKNGNKYLAWAFSEAAEMARRYDQDARSWYNRKLAKTNRMTAHNALAHKLARAAYIIMRDDIEFDSEKLFA